MHAPICTRTTVLSGSAGRRSSSIRYQDRREEEEGDLEMRSGGCAVQQELAADAAAVMRQAVSLAQRRGHAQVTPLHAASAMLSDAGAGGLLRTACLRSRSSSHPLQCKALELCLNVALNRLATAGPPTAAIMFPFHHAGAAHRPPALSNALAAAFKRAQANQRRGGGGSSASAEGQHHQHAAARVELEQLVISILDDPSVSRVMREAGFSSAEVKAHVDKAAAVSSPEQSSSNTASSTTSASPNNPKPKALHVDAARVLDSMASGRSRCVVVVAESAPAAEAVVKAVMDKVSKREDLRLQHEHERLRNAQFVPFSAASFRRLPREEVEARLGELRALVREGGAAGKGVVVVLEDLGHAAEAWAAASWKRKNPGGGGTHGRHYCYYCPVEHAVMELSSLVRGGGGGGRGHDMFWLLGFGAYASYTNCRSGQPSMEAVLDLHPVVVPDGSLALSLGGDSETTHCGADTTVATAASVPSWIRRCQQGLVLPTGSELTLSFSSPAASSSLCGFTHYEAKTSCQPWRHDLIDRRQPLLLLHDGQMAESCDQQLIANPNPGSSNSVSKSNSSDGGAAEPAARHRRRPRFTELTAENLKILCGALETWVSRHRDIAPGIASAVLRRRSGVTRTARPSSPATWLIFRGRDNDGMTAVARELARLVFGSYAEFTTITAGPELTLSPSGSNSGDSLKRKRSPDDEHRRRHMQRFYEAIRENPHRVVMVDGGGEHDSDAASIKNAMATGTVRGCDGDVVSLEDAIVVSCEVLEPRSRVSSPARPVKRRIMSDDVGSSKVEDEPVVLRLGLDLNACAAMDGEGEQGDSSPDDMEILKAVDGVFFFQCIN